MAFTENPAVNFDATIIDENAYTVMAKARDGNLGAIASVTRRPHFSIEGTTDTTSTALVALNLSDLGVPFAANTRRIVKVRSYASNAAGAAGHEVTALVQGATTTPIVVDQAVTLDGDGDEDYAAPLVAVSSNEVVVTAAGSSAEGIANWRIEVFVEPAVTQALVS